MSFRFAGKHLFWISKGLLGAVRMGGDHEPQFRAISSYVQRKVLAVTHTEVFTTTGVVGNQLVCYITSFRSFGLFRSTV